jgi:hypothetical protein
VKSRENKVSYEALNGLVAEIVKTGEYWLINLIVIEIFVTNSIWFLSVQEILTVTVAL